MFSISEPSSFSTEILYLSQTRFVDSLGGNKDFNRTTTSDLEKLASNSTNPSRQKTDTTALKENLATQAETLTSAQTGISEIEVTLKKATQSLKVFLSSEDGSTQKEEAKKSLIETKDSIKDIKAELDSIKNSITPSSIDSIIYSNVTQAVNIAYAVFSDLNLDDSNEALKGFYSIQKASEKVRFFSKQLNFVDSELRKTSAHILKIDIQNKVNLPFKAYDTGLINNDFLKNNLSDNRFMLNTLSLDKLNSGRLFSYLQ